MAAETILIVDDHHGMAKALAVLARSLGYQTRTVHDGPAALDALRSDPPDLLLLDLQMPGMSGWDVMRTLRADRAFDKLPIVVCSAATSHQSRDEAIRAGAQDYLGKDDAFSGLERILKQLLPDRAAPAE
jgi:CheY-like chemotaxis protein